MRQVDSMPDAVGPVTAEELARFPDDDHRYELVQGRVIRMSPVGYRHGKVVMRLGVLLGQHVQRKHLGAVLTEVGFKLESQPDTVRAPDLAFIRQARIPTPDPRGFWIGPPDLAIEVLSPDDRPSDIDAKVEEYLLHDVPCILVVDPEENTVMVFRTQALPLVLTPDETLDLTGIIDGFRCSVCEIFE